ncbi:MAG TPA: hypothetical protein PKY88_07320 [Anaerohalosphaeraceae bacterium]|nr:hypothetical protein [Anaerohalosphaeraceae bacterium]
MLRNGLILLGVWAVFQAGCASPSSMPPAQVRPCRGKGTIEEAVKVLALKRANLHPLKASARCFLEWTDSEGKVRKETFDAQFRYVPPDCLFVRGDKFGEIRFGTNAEAFWMMVKPEIDTYWWGTRQAAEQCREMIQFNPWNVIEALGVVQVDTNWTLDWHNGFDVLTLTDPNGVLVRKIWIRACDYQVISIESADSQGRQNVRIQMDDYVPTEQGFSVPSVIEAQHFSGGRADASLRLELRGVGLFEVDPVRAQRLFSRPSEENYRTVYRLSSACEFVLVGR